MCNYKYLGIEKEMNLEFNSKNESELKLLLNSSYFENPHIAKRYDCEYCEILVTNCQNENWWYRDLIGLQFFCQIRYLTGTYIKTISEFVGVKLTKNKIIIFRGFDPRDVIII